MSLYFACVIHGVFFKDQLFFLDILSCEVSCTVHACGDLEIDTICRVDFCRP